MVDAVGHIGKTKSGSDGKAKNLSGEWWFDGVHESWHFKRRMLLLLIYPTNSDGVGENKYRFRFLRIRLTLFTLNVTLFRVVQIRMYVNQMDHIHPPVDTKISCTANRALYFTQVVVGSLIPPLVIM